MNDRDRQMHKRRLISQSDRLRREFLLECEQFKAQAELARKGLFIALGALAAIRIFRRLRQEDEPLDE